MGKEGAYIDDLFLCPHHPDAGYPEERKEYKIKCECRKPGTALVEKARIQYNIDMEHSFFIGDSTIDIQTGKNAGLKTILVKTGEQGIDGKYDVVPDAVCGSLLEAARYTIAVAV